MADKKTTKGSMSDAGPISAMDQLELSRACQAGDWERAKALVQKGVDPAEPDMLGRRPAALWIKAAELAGDDQARAEAIQSASSAAGEAWSDTLRDVIESWESSPVKTPQAAAERVKTLALFLQRWPSPEQGGAEAALWKELEKRSEEDRLGERCEDKGALESLERALLSGPLLSVLKDPLCSASSGRRAIVCASLWLSPKKADPLPQAVSAALRGARPDEMGNIEELASSGLVGEALKTVEGFGPEGGLTLFCARFSEIYPVEKETFGFSAELLARMWPECSRAAEEEGFETAASYLKPYDVERGEAWSAFWERLGAMVSEVAQSERAAVARETLRRDSFWAARQCGLIEFKSEADYAALSPEQSELAIKELLDRQGDRSGLEVLARVAGERIGERSVAEGRDDARARAAARQLAKRLWEEGEGKAFGAFVSALARAAGHEIASDLSGFPGLARRRSQNMQKQVSQQAMEELMGAFPAKCPSSGEIIWSEDDCQWVFDTCSNAAAEALKEGLGLGSAPQRQGEAFWAQARERIAGGGALVEDWRRWDALAGRAIELAHKADRLSYWTRNGFVGSPLSERWPLPLAFNAFCEAAPWTAAGVIAGEEEGSTMWPAASGFWRQTLTGLAPEAKLSVARHLPQAALGMATRRGMHRALDPIDFAGSVSEALELDPEGEARLAARLIIACAYGLRAALATGLSLVAPKSVGEALPRAVAVLMETGDFSRPEQGDKEPSGHEKSLEGQSVSQGVSDARLVGAAVCAAVQMGEMSPAWGRFPSAGQPGALPSSPELTGALSALSRRRFDCERDVQSSLEAAREALRLGALIDGRAPESPSALETAVNKEPSDSARNGSRCAPLSLIEGLLKLGANPSAQGGHMDALERCCYLERSEGATAMANALLSAADCGEGGALAMMLARKGALSPKATQRIISEGMCHPKASGLARLFEGRMSEAAVKALAAASESEFLGAGEGSLMSRLMDLKATPSTLLEAFKAIQARAPEFELSSAQKSRLEGVAQSLDSRGALKEELLSLFEMGASKSLERKTHLCPAAARVVFGEDPSGVSRGGDSKAPMIAGQLPLAASFGALALHFAYHQNWSETASYVDRMARALEAGADPSGGAHPGASAGAIWGALEALGKQEPKEWGSYMARARYGSPPLVQAMEAALLEIELKSGGASSPSTARLRM